MNSLDIILNNLSSSRTLVQRCVAELSYEQLVSTPLDESLSAGWLVGHALFADYHALDQLGLLSNNLADLPHNFANRFDAWDRSTLLFQAEAAELPELFTSYRMYLIRHVREINEDSLDGALDGIMLPYGAWSFPYKTVGEMLIGLSAYTTATASVLSAVRVGLGHDPIPDILDDLLENRDL